MNPEKRETTVALGSAALVLVALALALLVFYAAGCASTPEITRGKVVNCTSQAVGQNWTKAYPEVMRCLTALIDSPVVCLDAIPTVAKVGIDVVACIVRDVGKSAGMAARVSEADAVTVRKAERAHDYLERRAFAFVD